MLRKRLANLLSVKSIITIAMTAVLVVLLLRPIEPNKEILALYCTSYGAVITYFFKHDEDKPHE